MVMFELCVNITFIGMIKCRVGERELPERIDSVRRAIFDIDLEIQDLKITKILPHERRIEKEIAFDPDLKNDSQRRARRCELEESSVFLELQEHLVRLKTQRDLLGIDLELLQNQFTRWKIEQRYMIASMSLDAYE
jgi:hypothetical protein